MWFSAAYISYQKPITQFDLLLESLFIIAGTLIPAIVGLTFVFSDKDLRKDFIQHKILNFRQVKSRYWILAIFLAPISLLLGQLLSVFFGHNLSSQFKFSTALLNSVAMVPFWFIFLYDPIAEELGWRSYGADSLRARFNLFTMILIFAVFWCLWHVPLFFINSYIHFDQLVAMGMLYVINYFISILCIAFLIMWLYYKSNRNIFIPILFHFSMDAVAELFQTHPDSKVIQTALLGLLCIAIMIKERKYFFVLKYQEDSN